jgi:Flp pilus assembly protein TadB
VNAHWGLVIAVLVAGIANMALCLVWCLDMRQRQRRTRQQSDRVMALYHAHRGDPSRT